MNIFFYRLRLAAAIVNLIFFSLNIATATSNFDVEFYNVGQGHCFIARTIKNGILIVDAGSSSTRKVEEITVTKNKKQQLAKQIFKSIKEDLGKLNKLNFIITHADKDHLNLAKPIITKVRKKFSRAPIKFILGGEESDYSTSEALELVKYIKDQKIPHAYGSAFEKKGLLWKPPRGFAFQSGKGESVDFLSVKALAKPRITRKYAPTEEQKKNASSIVVKIKGGGGSIMIAGDKTRAEIALLIGLYENAGKLKELESDVLLGVFPKLCQF